MTAAVAGAAAPATTSIAVDLSSPKSAAKTLFNAISQGDRDAVRAALFAGDDAQAQLVAAMADLIVSGKRLGDAAHEKFGKAGDPIGRGMLDPSDLAKLEQAKETPGGAGGAGGAGDTVTLQVEGQPRPMSFRRQDGRWKLVVTDFAGAAPENIGKQTRLIRLMGDVMDESAGEVAAGKYATPDAALTVIQKRLHEVMINFNRPATTRSAASTQP